MAIKPTRFPNGIEGPIVPASGTQSAITSLTDDSGGATTGDSLATITGSYNQTIIANNQAALARKINEIIDALETAQILDS